MSEQEREELARLLTRADAYLSLLRYRGGIAWGGIGMCQPGEVEQVIGLLRNKAAELRKGLPTHDEKSG